MRLPAPLAGGGAALEARNASGGAAGLSEPAAAGPGASAASDLGRALRLLEGVRVGLSGGGDSEGGGLLLPWTRGKAAPGDDPHDYLTGPAVFWRYALHAARSGPPQLREALSEPGFRRFVFANAAAAAAAPLPAAAVGACARLVNLTNDLAVLVAALPRGEEYPEAPRGAAVT